MPDPIHITFRGGNHRTGRDQGFGMMLCPLESPESSVSQAKVAILRNAAPSKSSMDYATRAETMSNLAAEQDLRSAFWQYDACIALLVRLRSSNYDIHRSLKRGETLALSTTLTGSTFIYAKIRSG